MKEITREMIKTFKLNKLGYDQMGYIFNNTKQLSYHHMIIANKDGGLMTFENGAILRQNTSHDYLHCINLVDPEIFYLITSELIDENIKRKVDIENLRKIRDLLLYFEREHDHDYTKKGKLLIKREFVEGRVILWV